MSTKPRGSAKAKATNQRGASARVARRRGALPTIRQRVRSWVRAYLARFYSRNALTNDANLTNDLHFSAAQLPGLAIAFEFELEHNRTWNVDLRKFSLGGTELNDAVLSKTLGDLISYITKKVEAAQRS